MVFVHYQGINIINKDFHDFYFFYSRIVLTRHWKLLHNIKATPEFKEIFYHKRPALGLMELRQNNSRTV